MDDVQNEVEHWIASAAQTALDLARVDPLIRPAKDPRFGDYQANLAMALAKQLARKPRELAEAIVEQLRVNPEATAALERIEIAGPGFINLGLSTEYLARRLQHMARDERLGVLPAPAPNTVVVDYSSPNLAKEMHVGHLRSTIIGDAICRVLEFQGHRVIRHNHLGDWGTQFGMLLEHLIDIGWAEGEDHSIGDLNDLYQTAKRSFDTDSDFKERARTRVVALQSGEERSHQLWQQLIAESVRHMNDVYARLGIRLQDSDIRPESYYNDRLPQVVVDLREAGLLVEDQGAKVVFPEGFANKEGNPLPLIVQKSDGGFGYAATDLAAARYRVSELGADRVIYVVDSRQSDHFQMVFWTLRAAGWVPAEVSLDHVAFGKILGENRKPFQTREGGTVKLIGLLEEATERAARVVKEKSPELDENASALVAKAVGVGAVKYADLSNERIKDYVFDYDRMLALEGNTAPYLQYAYARVQSIFRKGDVETAKLDPSALTIEHPAERALAVQLLLLPRAIHFTAESLEPHRLCAYLYEVASLFHAFFRQCKVLKASTSTERESRLSLCLLTARTLELGLSLLGIETIRRM